MSLLLFDATKCVRATNKLSTCKACEEVCAVETIRIDSQLPNFVPNECVGCGGCAAACPDAAFGLDDFSAIEYIFELVEEKRELLSCKESIPCLAALSIEELISLALLHPSNHLVLDRAYCKECELGRLNEPIIKMRIEEANFFLQAIEAKKHLEFREVGYEPKQAAKDRRAFLANLNLKEALRAKQKFQNEIEATSNMLQEATLSQEDTQKIREAKDVPHRRKLLMMALKRTQKPNLLHKLRSDDISFISQKVLDEKSCTNCQMCYRICPTGALSSDKQNGAIFFDAIACIKCASCHDVCEPRSLELRSVFDLAALFEPKRETLVRFDMRRCNECGLAFAYRGGEVICRRCAIEEEEAMSLWGIDPSKRSF